MLGTRVIIKLLIAGYLKSHLKVKLKDNRTILNETVISLRRANEAPNNRPCVSRTANVCVCLVSVFWAIIRDSRGSLLNERLVSEGLATCVPGVSNSIPVSYPPSNP